MLLEGRVAMISGAGRGIGLGIAETLARQGARVVIGDLAPESAIAAAVGLCDQGLHAWGSALDVTASESCAQFVADSVSAHGRLDILVNNAGIFHLHPSEAMPEEAWRAQLDVMLTGAFLLSQAAARVMIPQRAGSIVMIASIGGMGGWPQRAAYNAAKAGLIVLGEVLASEWAQHNIRVNCVSPGVTRTEMVAAAVRAGVTSLERYEHRTPLGRLAEVQEIADAVAFLVSDRASAISGVNLRVDGGWVPWANPMGLGFPEEAADER